MDELEGHTLSAFRTGLELSSKEPAQLRRTIEELERQIQEKDYNNQFLIDENNDLKRVIVEQTGDIQKLTEDKKIWYGNFQNMKRLERASNIDYDAIIEDFEDGFSALYHESVTRIGEYLDSLKKMPESPEIKSLFARVKHEVRAINLAKSKAQISPVNALRQLTDLETAIVKFIIDRPRLRITRVEVYRAEILLEVLAQDRNMKSISGPEAIKILAAREERPIFRSQAIRAMRRAALLRADRARFEVKRKKSYLIKIGEEDLR